MLAGVKLSKTSTRSPGRDSIGGPRARSWKSKPLWQNYRAQAAVLVVITVAMVLMFI
jgi:hypothetical protein